MEDKSDNNVISETSMAGRTMALMLPKDAHFLIPGTCDHVTLCGNGVFADVIKDTEPWNDPGFSGWAQSYHLSS